MTVTRGPDAMAIKSRVQEAPGVGIFLEGKNGESGTKKGEERGKEVGHLVFD